MNKVIALVFLILLLGGCSTMEGLGKDMKKLGEKIEETASEATN